MSNSSGLFVILLLIVSIAILFGLDLIGINRLNSITNPDEPLPTNNCDLKTFSYEYSNSSSLLDNMDIPIRYNGETIRFLSVKSIILPIYDQNCSLVKDNDIILNSLQSLEFKMRLPLTYNYSQYRNIGSCHAASGGAESVCHATNDVLGFIDSDIITEISNHDKTSLFILKTLAPYGWKARVENIGDTSIQFIKYLKGGTVGGFTLVLANTYSCLLNDTTSSRIYDYSIVGNQLIKRVEQYSFYDGSLDSIKALNGDLINFYKSSDFSEFLNSIPANVLRGGECPFGSSKDKFLPLLNETNFIIDQAKGYGKIKADGTIAFITQYHKNASISKIYADNNLNCYNDILKAIFYINKLPDYISLCSEYGGASSDFNKGLYLSSVSKYNESVDRYFRWKIVSEWDRATIVIWMTILLLLIYILTLPNKYQRNHSGVV